MATVETSGRELGEKPACDVLSLPRAKADGIATARSSFTGFAAGLDGPQP